MIEGVGVVGSTSAPTRPSASPPLVLTDGFGSAIPASEGSGELPLALTNERRRVVPQCEGRYRYRASGSSILQANFSPQSGHWADRSKPSVSDPTFFRVLSTLKSISTYTRSEQCGHTTFWAMKTGREQLGITVVASARRSRRYLIAASRDDPAPRLFHRVVDRIASRPRSATLTRREAAPSPPRRRPARRRGRGRTPRPRTTRRS